MSKQQKIFSFNPNDASQKGANIFGLPFTLHESDIVIVPVPWEVTVSYSAGTAQGPMAILNASLQVDLYDEDFPELWKRGIFMLPIDRQWQVKNNTLRKQASAYIRMIESGKDVLRDKKARIILEEVNKACTALCETVQKQTTTLLQQNKLVGLLGGDHSVPLGFLYALAQCYETFGILQIDAHMDLRQAYEGFIYSHASIMYNALQLPQVKKLVQVGIRDFCEEENNFVKQQSMRIKVFTDASLKRSLFAGTTWQSLCEKIISELPQKVYISFDIDGLNPALCPRTGTPVPGGLSFQEAVYLIKGVTDSGRQVIGFDLCEVAPGSDEWDANVGARILFKLCGVISKNV